jgi:DNA polymerase V
VLTIGYDIENLTDETRRKNYHGEIHVDHYGRKVPKHAHGTANLGTNTSSARLIMEEVLKLYDRIVDPQLLIRRVTIVANHVIGEADAPGTQSYEQLDLFTDYETRDEELEKERKLQEAMLSVRKKYGKNAILKGTNLCEGATTRDRNSQIGGHRA